MNQAGGDHGAAVPGRVAHFFDIVAYELVGGLRMSGVDLTKIVHKDLRINPARGRYLKTHEVADVSDEGVAVVQLDAPEVGARLQLSDMGDDSIVLLLVDQHAIARSDVLVLEVAVGPARIRGDGNIMPHNPHRGVITLWRKPSNVFLAGWLADTAEYNKGVTVIPGLARTKLDVVLPGSARGGRARCIRRPHNLRL